MVQGRCRRGGDLCGLAAAHLLRDPMALLACGNLCAGCSKVVTACVRDAVTRLKDVSEIQDWLRSGKQ